MLELMSQRFCKGGKITGYGPAFVCRWFKRLKGLFMKFFLFSMLPLLLISAVICISASSPAVARNPIPVEQQTVINPSCADPGEDPHLSILVEPGPASCEDGGASGGNLAAAGQKQAVIRDHIALTYKFGLFIYSFYSNIDKILF